jgi:hypothetical protein
MRKWLDGEPVWSHERILKTWGIEFEMYRRAWSRRGLFTDRVMLGVESTVAMMHTRDKFIQEFGFAIPCAEVFKALAKYPTVVEIGAGSGYMTRLMRHAGIRCVGSDSGDGGYAHKVGRYDDWQIVAQGKTMVRRHRDSAIFCSWPAYEGIWFRQALKAMQVGQVMAVIREDATAEETAWDYFDDCFDVVERVDIPAFNYLNDFVDIRIKKRQRPRHGQRSEAISALADY